MLNTYDSRYYVCVSNVLTSVQKTEESLRRLKKMRERGMPSTATEGRGLGDDEKIRRQIAIDVRYFCSEVRCSTGPPAPFPLAPEVLIYSDIERRCWFISLWNHSHIVDKFRYFGLNVWSNLESLIKREATTYSRADSRYAWNQHRLLDVAVHASPCEALFSNPFAWFLQSKVGLYVGIGVDVWRSSFEE